MDKNTTALVSTFEDDLIHFAQDIIKIKSYSCNEREVVERIREEMIKLDYDHVMIDKVGNVIGVIGNGPTKILFDSHIDTVEVNTPEEWTVDPFGGEIKDGKLYGRGASDMKSSAASSVYAGYGIKKLGLDKDKTIYVCCSALEEDFDGEGLYHAIVDNDLRPDYVIICEPTHLQISLGQRGRSIYRITAEGLSAHGSAPEKGVNAIYKMQKILARIEELNEKFMAKEGEKGSIAVSKIESSAASLCSIAESCSIYIDRRMTLSEDEAFIAKEMDALVADTNAWWEIYHAYGTSWTGENIVFKSFLPAWEIKEDHPLAKACINAFTELYDKKPLMYKWDFSTNGVASANKLGIPTIGFGAGIEKLSHTTDEYCPVSDIISACQFYTLLSKYL